MSRYDELLNRNKYDAILDAPQQRLRTAVRGALGRDPDQTAEVATLSARTGVPSPIVERNRDAVAQQDELTRYDGLLERSPELARFLSDGENAAVARDDVASLSGLEWATKAFRAAHREQWKSIELGTLRARQMGQDLTPEEAARATQLKREITGSDFGADNWFEKIIVETGRMLPTMERVASDSLRTGALTGLGFAGAAAVGGQAGPQVLSPEEVITVPAAGALGFRMGAAAGAAKSTYELEAGLAFDEFLDIRGEDGQALDVDTARNAAAMVGTVNAALEVTGFAALARFVPGLNRLVSGVGRKAVAESLKRATFRDAARRLATGYAVGVGTEVGTEVLQEATTILGAEIAKTLSPGQFQGTTAEAVGARLADIAIKTTQGVALIGGVGPGARFVSDAQRAQQAQRNQAVFEALGQHATDSKLRQRLPERFQAYVARLREGGEVQDVRIPVEEFATYFQTQGLDPAEVAREVTGSDAAYTEAQAAGTDLVIPLEAYATRLAPTDHHAALMPNLRLRPDEMTAREAEQWRAQSETLTQELADTAAGTANPPSAVYDDVLGQLLASGIERGAAEQNAQLMASVFETLGSRTGTDPMELYERYGLRVRPEVPAVLQNVGKLDTDLDPLIDRLRAGKLPTDEEVYGPSLVDFLLEKGGLQDQGGELAARDVQKLIRGLVKKKGRTFDEAVELASEAGYLAQGATQNELLAALDREIKGERAFRPNALNQGLLDLRTALNDLGDYLGQQGVDLAQTDNAAVRKLLQSATTFEQPVFHGSRHKFDRFSTDKIGLGEGNQAFGWGLYFAENPKVARSYTTAGQVAYQNNRVAELVYRAFDATGEDKAAKDWLFKRAEEAPQEYRQLYYDAMNNYDVVKDAGNLYEVDIPDSAVVRMLDWDKNVSEQAPEVRKALESIDDAMFRTWQKNGAWEHVSGQTLYRHLSDGLTVGSVQEGKHKAASLRLAAAGIPGVKYRDALSRGADEGTRNLVVFDDSVIEIKSVNGKPFTAEQKKEFFQSAAGDLTKEQLAAFADGVKAEHGIEEIDLRLLPNGDIRLDTMAVKRTSTGAGTRAMEAVTAFADKHGRRMVLSLAEKGYQPLERGPKTTSPERLRKFYERFGFVSNRGRNKDFTLNDSMYRRPKGTTLDQKFEEARRGSIEFGAARKFTINLLKNRDLSTFLHESGHLYLEVLGDLAEATDAPEQIVQDYAAILKWFGVEARSAIKVEHHEKFARGFEAYLFEGKAPSVDLQNAFARFRAWLVSIYRKMTALNVDLTAGVRGVFDRLVATDDAIAGAEEAQNYVAIFADAETAGMTPEQFAAYRKTVQAARTQAEDDLSHKLLAVMTREQKAWWKERRVEVLATVTAEVHGRREYKALSFLRFGQNPDSTEVAGVAPVKLDKGVLTREFGYPQEFLNRLPGAGKSKVYTSEGGVHPDIVAAMFGYKGAADLVTDLINARPMKELIAAETDARMREIYPDPLVDGSLADHAIQAVHSGKRAELLAAELRALNRKRREVSPFVRAAEQAQARQQREAREANRAQLPDRDEIKLIRAAAERAVAGKRVRDVQPGTYRVAEAKAARAAFAAAEKGDFEVAYFEKRKQLLNHELFMAAESAIEEAEAARNYFKRFGRKALRERIGLAQDGAIEKIDALLAEVELARVSNKVVDARAVKAGILEQIDNGDLVVDDATLAMLRAQPRNWRELSFEALVGLRDVIKQLEHQALETSEAIVNGEKIKIKDAAEAVAASITASNKAVGISLGTKTPGESAAKVGAEFLAAWLRPAAIARQLDGGADFGATLRTVIEPIRRAYAEKLLPLERKIREDVAALYRTAFTDAELKGLSQRGVMPSIDATATRGDLLSLALNWGNEGNRKALLDSQFEGEHVYTEQAIAQALGSLTAKDWAFVQSVWDYIDTYWPQLSALEKRRRGIAPKKVEAAAFTVTTADGQRIDVRGGYYPLAYNGELSQTQGADDAAKAWERMQQGRAVTASTRAGATHERVGSGGKVVRLGLGVIDGHLLELARDLSLYDEVRFVNRVLHHASIKSATATTGNGDALSTLKLWLQDAAIGEMAARDRLSKTSAWLRTGFTTSKLAWNLVTTGLQITGLPQSMVVVGSKAIAHGLARYLAGPLKAHRVVMEASAFMRTRYQTNSWNKDVADTKAYLQNRRVVPTKLARNMNAIAHSFFWPIAKMQMQVDSITWLGAYWKAETERKLTGKDAIAYADSAVENAQTSGFFTDRSAVERGTLDALQQRQSQFVKLWTTLISYQLAKANIAYEKGRAFMRAPSLWGATTLTTDVMMLYAVEAILAGIVRGTLPDDDDESWAAWVAKESVGTAVGGIPFVREISSARFGGGNTPLGGLANDVWRAIEQSSQGEADAPMIKAFNNVGGTVFHYPSTQINRAVDAYWADSEGEDVSPYEYLTGPRDD